MMAMIWAVALIFDLVLMFDLLGKESTYSYRFLEKSIAEVIQLSSFGLMMKRKESKGSRGIHAIVYTVVSVGYGIWMIYEMVQSLIMVCDVFTCSGESTIYWNILGNIYEFNWLWWIVYFSFVRVSPLIIRVYFCVALISYWRLKESDLMI